ncbi:MAG: HAD-IIIA family hydrolase [Prevotellaceae bacterium]|nr:HAD-IIIA family hydrolase [Prevotellaceae bacterium]
MIKYLIMDVDGTLTDGMIYMDEDGEMMKAFNIKDGYGIAVMLPQRGITPVVITGRWSEIVTERCKELKIKHCFQDVKDKLETLHKFLSKQGGTLSECAYIGDDLNDMPCMKCVKESGGITACPSDAVEDVKRFVDFVSTNKGGCGAVRDFIDNCIL